MDILTTQLKERSTSLRTVERSFRIVSPVFLCKSSDYEIFVSGQEFFSTYSEDVSDTISNQLLSFKGCFENELKKMNSTREMLEFILLKNYSSCSSFSEIVTACYLFLTLPVTVASAERSFSKLKIIKNYLRSTMGQERLSSLAIISIENKIAKSLDISSLVTAFANAKARKKMLF